MEKETLRTIGYFSIFSYPPDIEEIYTFLRKKARKTHVVSILEKMERKKLVKTNIFREFSIKNRQPDTPPQYSITRYLRAKSKNSGTIRKQWDECRKKHKFSWYKLRNSRFRLYMWTLSLCPQIRLVGLSGTVSMMNAKRTDDIDLFIITAGRRLWTARLISLTAAQLLGLRRKAGELNAQDKVCLNLYFDESDLTVPRHKQTEYVAHEVLQMKPLINKNFTYEYFLTNNKWIYRIFPNAKKTEFVKKNVKKNNNIVGNFIEFCLKKLQLISIKLHQTNEIVTGTQLWFFPQDFEKDLSQKYS